MGSLLALPPSVDVNSMGLETDAAKILAHAFQDYGAYTVDDTAWSVYGIATEYSPSGKVDDEFGAAWGFPISPLPLSSPTRRRSPRAEERRASRGRLTSARTASRPWRPPPCRGRKGQRTGSFPRST